MTAEVQVGTQRNQADPFFDLVVPEQLQASLTRHRENLARLIASLQSVGISEEQIESSIAVVVSSYKEELLQAIKAMVA